MKAIHNYVKNNSYYGATVVTLSKLRITKDNHKLLKLLYICRVKKTTCGGVDRETGASRTLF